ncbi:MAG: MFS transporter [Bacillota bacterium]|nr:MFS transporter [Bacillota bacterium]
MDEWSTIKNKLSDSFPALRQRDFRYFWTGQCISLLGTWMQRTAQQWLVYNITKSPLLLGVLGVVQFAPMLLFSLVAGVFVDRFPKKNLIIVTQIILMFQALVLAVLVWTGNVRYWHILLLAGIMGLVNTIDMPTRQSFIIELVGKKDLMNAIALNSSIVNVARILGPALSGVIMVYLGPAFCFFLNGISFIAVIIGLFKIKVRGAVVRTVRGKVTTDIVEGLKYIAANRVLLGAVLSMFVVGTFSINSDVIIPVMAKEVLHQQAGGYGLLLSAMAVGSFIAAVTVAAKSKKGPNRKFLIACSILVSLSQMIIIFIHSYLLTVIALVFVGFFTISFTTTVNSTIQLNSSSEYRGRVVSVYMLAFNGTTPIGNLFAGDITERFGANAGFFGCGAVTLILMAIVLVFMRHKTIKINRSNNVISR